MFAKGAVVCGDVGEVTLGVILIVGLGGTVIVAFELAYCVISIVDGFFRDGIALVFVDFGAE